MTRIPGEPAAESAAESAHTSSQTPAIDSSDLRFQETMPPKSGPNSDGDDDGEGGEGDADASRFAETIPPAPSSASTSPNDDDDDADASRFAETIPPTPSSASTTSADGGDVDTSRFEETVPPRNDDAAPAPSMPMVTPTGPTAPRTPAKRSAHTADVKTSTASHRTKAHVPTEEEEFEIQVGATFGKYQLIRELGRGGMGAVYLARDIRLGRLAAIKFLRVADSELQQQFLSEARTTAQCNHENIVVLYEADEYTGLPYMVLEYIEGRTLKQIIDERREAQQNGQIGKDEPLLPVERVAELLTPVLKALDRAHGMGIVHCDLKPANIMLTDTGVIKVLDFGIARVLAHSHRRPDSDCDSQEERVPAKDTGGGIGTLPYMSPEQFSGRDIDHRTDVWAMGIILYEMLTGQHPLWPLSIPRLDQIRRVNVPMPLIQEARPDLGSVASIIDRCLLKPIRERTASAAQLMDELEPLLPGRQRLARQPDQNPFAGLSAFQEADADRFFGRSSDIANIVTRVRYQPLVAVIGPSGVGKSSLIRAGVIPVLKSSGEGWDSMVIRPSRAPLEALASLLEQLHWETISHQEKTGSGMGDSVGRGLSELLRHTSLVEQETADMDTGEITEGAGGDDESGSAMLMPVIIKQLASEPGYLGTILRGWAQRHRRRLLIFVDQFEELYTLTPKDEQREAFLACLSGVADDASSPLRIIFTMRADFLERMAVERAFMTKVSRGLTFLAPMGRDGLREALCRPVDQAGYEFDSENLVEDILDELESTRGALPLMQFTASRLWEARHRENKQLTRTSYEKMGGVTGTLAHHADEVLHGMSAGQAKLTRAIFQRLVTPERTRAIVSMNELALLSNGGSPHENEDEGDVDEVISILADSRLVVIETKGNRGGASGGDRLSESVERAGDSEATVEIVHESLIQGWPTLTRWLDENRQDAQFLARLRSASRQWQAGAESEGLLWRGEAAEDARRWQMRQQRAEPGGNQTVLGQRETKYLSAVIALHERERRRRQRTIAATIAALALFAAVVTVLAIRADYAAERARLESVQARNALRMATARDFTQGQKADPTHVFALVRELEPIDAQGRADAALPPGWARLARESLYQGIARAILPVADELLSIAVSPDGRWIASAATDGKVRIVPRDKPATGNRPMYIIDTGTEPAHAVAFAPSGGRLAVSYGAGAVRVYTLELNGAGPDVAGADATEADTAAKGQSFAYSQVDGHDEPVWALAFSPDGERLVTASEDHDALVHDVVHHVGTAGSGDDRQPLHVLDTHAEPVRAATFSSDGKLVITASIDGSAHIHLIEEDKDPPDKDPLDKAPGIKSPLIILGGHMGPVLDAELSPDRRLALTASADGSARLWDLANDSEVVAFTDHKRPVLSATFSPDGRRVLTTSADHSARVYDLDGSPQPRVVGSRVLRGHTGEVTAGAFSPDGTHAMTASRDGTVRLWNLVATGAAQRLAGEQKGLLFADINRDGDVVTATRADKALVFPGPKNRPPPAGPAAASAPSSTGPNGQGSDQLPGSPSNEAATSAPHRPELAGDGGFVFSARFDPAGQRVVLASNKKALIYRVDDVDRLGRGSSSGDAPATPLLSLGGHDGIVLDAAFGPDGATIATASQDKSARIWDATTGALLHTFDAHDAPVHAVAFSPNGAYLATGSEDGIARIFAIQPVNKPAGPAESPGARQPLLVLPGHTKVIHSLAFSPDDAHLLTGSDDQNVFLWPVQTPLQTPLQTMGSTSGSASESAIAEPRVFSTSAGLQIRGQPFSPDGAHFVGFTGDGELRVFAIRPIDSHGEIGGADPIPLWGPTGTIRSASFSPDGARIIAVSDGKEGGGGIWLWNNLRPIVSIEDPRLWRASEYCMPVDRRQSQLNLSASVAQQNFERCTSRVEQYHAP